MKKLIKYLAIVAILLLTSLPIQAQDYNLKEMPPLDPKVSTGVLDNGIHYYIRVNKLPEKRGEFYIAHNVGAILEDDDQNGLAHFTEHMAFNGTENFPKKGILDYLATIGVKFGTNVNASTGLEQTVYNISNVPLTREGILDSCLLVLHDWSNYISFEQQEVDLERGVIREEWRIYGTAEERMSNKLAPIIYKNSKYAIRNVIGDTAVINHFKRETIIRFYKKWYRPDLQAIVIVGDFDENLVEAKIKKLFGTIPKAQNPIAKGEFPLPDNKEVLIGTATDKEATSTMVNVSFKHNTTPDDQKNLGYMRQQLVRNLINAMMGQRMSELSRQENPPFISARFSYRPFTRTKDAFSGMAVAANNESLKALTALLIEIERMKKYGFTSGEYERAKADLLRNYESRYMERDKRKNRELVRPITGYFLTNSPNPGIEFEYQFAKAMIPGISLDELNTTAKNFIRDDNEIVTITGPDKPGTTLPSEKEIQNVLMTYKNTTMNPYVDNLSGKKLIEKEPVPGKIVKAGSNSTFGTSEWTLSNGMKIVFKPTDIREDELLIQGFSAGGVSQLKDELVPSSEFLGDVVSQMGIGAFSRNDLDKMLAGKRVNVSLGISDEQDVVSARTSPKDLETAFELIYLAFTNPRWNETDYKTWMEKTKAFYINAASEPRKAFSDTVTVIMASHNKRERPMTYDLLNEVSFDKVQKIYKERFSDPGNFTFLFVGKIDPNAVKPFVEKYMASLPSVNQKDEYKDNGIRPPKGKVVNDFTHESKTPRTSVVVNYSGTCEYTTGNRLLASALRHILELRYVQSIREDEGGAYHVGITFNIGKYPVPMFQMNVSFETDPAKASRLIEIVYSEVKKILASGPTDSDLQKAKEYFLKQRSEDMKENNWWMSALKDYYFYGLDWLTGYENRVRALSIQSVHDFAKKTLTQGNVVQVVMRPEK